MSQVGGPAVFPAEAIGLFEIFVGRAFGGEKDEFRLGRFLQAYFPFFGGFDVLKRSQRPPRKATLCHPGMQVRMKQSRDVEVHPGGRAEAELQATRS